MIAQNEKNKERRRKAGKLDKLDDWNCVCSKFLSKVFFLHFDFVNFARVNLLPNPPNSPRRLCEKKKNRSEKIHSFAGHVRDGDGVSSQPVRQRLASRFSLQRKTIFE